MGRGDSYSIGRKPSKFSAPAAGYCETRVSSGGLRKGEGVLTWNSTDTAFKMAADSKASQILIFELWDSGCILDKIVYRNGISEQFWIVQYKSFKIILTNI